MLSNPVYDPFLILTKIYSDGAHVKQAITDIYIEEQYRARTVKIVYGVLENDGYFDFCIKHYAPKAPKLAVRILLKISLYMLLFMDKKRYMVTDCAVTLCKKLGKSGVSGFVNAFLRRFDRAAVDGASRWSSPILSICCFGRFRMRAICASSHGTVPLFTTMKMTISRASVI